MYTFLVDWKNHLSHCDIDSLLKSYSPISLMLAALGMKENPLCEDTDVLVLETEDRVKLEDEISKGGTWKVTFERLE